MNILIVSGQWTTEPKAAGVQSTVCTLVEALSKNHTVGVFVPSWQETSLVQEDIGVLRVYRRRERYPSGRGWSALKTTLAWLIDLPAMLRDLRRIFRAHQTEVIHLHQLQASQATFVLARLLGGPPYVATFHGRDVRDYHQRPWLERLVVRLLARHAAVLTAVSRDLATQAEVDIPGVRKVHVVRNGVGILSADDDGTVQEMKGSLPTKYFVSIGRLDPLDGFARKGHDVLIHAWSKLGARFPDVHLVIAGIDDGRAGYEKLARECGVSARIHILGSLPRPRLFAVMKNSMGVVTASRAEGGGPTMTILECGFFGLPLIASNIPPHAESLEDGVDCLLVPTDDPDSVAKAVERLIDDRRLAGKLGKALQCKVLAFGSGERMADSYVKVAYIPALRFQKA